jgi:uncharacterized protein YdbL (DUF1318 family)
MLKRFILAALIALTAALPAWAIELDAARSQGLVGERADGLIGAIQDNADVAALVQSVNAARLADYRGIAEKEGTKLEAVQAIAGTKQIERARANGWYYMDASGAWKR